MQGLYTSKEISEIYRVPKYTVTQYWIPKGLKHIRGNKKSYLFKIEWVENFLEENAIEVSTCNKSKKVHIRTNNKKENCFVH